MEDGTLLPVLVENRTGYANLCSLLTQAHLRSEKGSCLVRYRELEEFSAGLIALFSAAAPLQTPRRRGRWPVASGGSPDAGAEEQARD